MTAKELLALSADRRGVISRIFFTVGTGMFGALIIPELVNATDTETIRYIGIILSTVAAYLVAIMVVK